MLIFAIVLTACTTIRERQSVRDAGKETASYDKNYDTIRYFDSTYVRTIETDSLREILRERIILGERTVREIHHDTLLRWERDTIYVEEAGKKKEEKTLPGWAKALIVALSTLLLTVIGCMLIKRLPLLF